MRKKVNAIVDIANRIDEMVGTDTILFTMGEEKYQIKLVSQEELQKHIVDPNDGYYFGQTKFLENTVYLDKNLSPVRLKKTLIHELMHCYIREYVTTYEKDYTEDDVCDLIANAYYIIRDVLYTFDLREIPKKWGVKK